MQTATAVFSELQSAISSMESLIAQLVFVAGFRDLNSGIYHHPSEPKDSAPPEADRFLRQVHEGIFAKWLTLGLEEQQTELKVYFSDLECGKALALQTWMNLEPYHGLIPASAEPIERQLFLSDLELVLRLMAQDLSVEELEVLKPKGSLVTVAELSGHLGISCRSLRLWAQREKVPATKVGRQWRFVLADVARWIRGNKSRCDWLGFVAPPEGQTRRPADSKACIISCSGTGTFALTRRERDILDLIASGSTIKEISASLSISDNTVREHRKHICAKLGLHSSVELVACAVSRWMGTCRQVTPQGDRDLR